MKQNEGDLYLQSYPKLKKWMRTCVCCGAYGYAPEMPDELTKKIGGEEWVTLAGDNIRKHFFPLKVNESGLCETCERLLSGKR